MGHQLVVGPLGFRRLLTSIRIKPRSRGLTAFLGARYCTPEINTSEIIVDFQWHSPMDSHFCDFWCVIVCPALPTHTQLLLCEVRLGLELPEPVLQPRLGQAANLGKLLVALRLLWGPRS